MKVAKIENPIDAVLTQARSWLEVREAPRNSNRGVVIDFCNYNVARDWRDFPIGVRGAPWCAAFVSTVGQLALGDAWPVRRTAACQAIADWATEEGVLVRHPEKPEVGDLFLLYYQRLGRFGHVGFVTGVQGNEIITLEGNTGPDGSREGFGVFQRRRPVGEKTAFVRWLEQLNGA